LTQRVCGVVLTLLSTTPLVIGGCRWIVGIHDVTGPEAGADAGAEAGADAGACGQATLMADGFEEGVIGPLWVHDTWLIGSVLFEEEGQAVVVHPANQAQVGVAFSSGSAYDLTGSHVEIDISAVNPTPDVQTLFQLVSGRNRVLIAECNGQISFQSWANDSLTWQVNNQYDPTSHRFWRIRESGGTVFWELSDGTSVTWQDSQPTPEFVRSVHVTFGTWSSDAIPDPAGRLCVESIAWCQDTGD
jgi:hypothetical protein